MKQNSQGVLTVDSYTDLIGWQIVNAFHLVGNDASGLGLVISRDTRVKTASGLRGQVTVFCPIRFLPTLVIQYELKRRE